MAQVKASVINGASFGLAVKVAATASAGTTIHTAQTTVTTAGSYDEIDLWAYNSDTVSRLLTIQWGGTTSPDNDIKVPIGPQSGLVLVVAGLRLQNSLVVRAYAAVPNVITIYGTVNVVTA